MLKTAGCDTIISNNNGGDSNMLYEAIPIGA